MEFEKTRLNRIALTTSDHLHFTDKEKIVYCESCNNQTKIFFSNGEKIVVPKTLKEVENFLKGDCFVRIHASYLINITHANKLTRGDKGHLIMSNNQRIAISRKRRNYFLDLFSKL